MIYIISDQSLDIDKVELDIAKLKQEVDSTSDEDSLWSDFFSEDDVSEISPEYELLLKSLLSTPVDDIDLSLNVFNNVDEESEEKDDRINGFDRSVLVGHIMSGMQFMNIYIYDSKLVWRMQLMIIKG